MEAMSDFWERDKWISPRSTTSNAGFNLMDQRETRRCNCAVIDMHGQDDDPVVVAPVEDRVVSAAPVAACMPVGRRPRLRARLSTLPSRGRYLAHIGTYSRVDRRGSGVGGESGGGVAELKGGLEGGRGTILGVENKREKNADLMKIRSDCCCSTAFNSMENLIETPPAGWSGVAMSRITAVVAVGGKDEKKKLTSQLKQPLVRVPEVGNPISHWVVISAPVSKINTISSHRNAVSHVYDKAAATQNAARTDTKIELECGEMAERQGTLVAARLVASNQMEYLWRIE
ncbi:hypothetical protein B0H13DRAFT_1901332 [Mycena leptocephala]|nr:hypothetical protein B0H13DRAFT_1901332 [Mycena leptocephala]